MEWVLFVLAVVVVATVAYYVSSMVRRRGGRPPEGVTNRSIGGGRGAGPFGGEAQG
jgi:hypothetical protein